MSIHERTALKKTQGRRGKEKLATLGKHGWGGGKADLQKKLRVTDLVKRGLKEKTRESAPEDCWRGPLMNLKSEMSM